MPYKLVVGLGNVGEKYKKTRHNAGFIALDHLVDFYDLRESTSKFSVKLFTGIIINNRVLAIYPQNFMNLSGESVSRIANFYKIDPTDIFVLYDDFCLKIGKIRLSQNIRSSTHNGIRSLEKYIIGFNKVRIGITMEDEGKFTASSYVLSNFNDNDFSAINEIARKIAKNIPMLLNGDSDRFLNEIHNK